VIMFVFFNYAKLAVCSMTARFRILQASFEGFIDRTVAKNGGVSSDEHYSTSFGVSRALAMPELQSKWDLPVPDIFYW